MHEPDEASYYEIALTNRQVLVAFVILLVCMLSAFFAGLWAGRGGQLAVPPDPMAMLAEETPPTEDGLEEFTFFSDSESQEAEDLQEVVLGADPETTLNEDLGGDPPARAEPAPPPPAPARKKKVQEDPARQTNPAIPRATARQPAAPSAGDLFVQVLSVRERRQARKVLQQLLDAGYGAFLSPIQVEDQTMYRVRIGPFTTRPAAAEVAERVRQVFKLESWITS
ncbi:MAG: SPOR domain-containing protein [Deltaproteobacteria bacterium]|nr:SPOR domain-containing protein [Deltaproteobacteria bacterium]